ncbi:MAG: alpha/beta hydrolase, partial [Pseudomonadota bacterium]
MLSTVAVVTGTYVVLLLAVFFGQSHLLYLPTLPSRELSSTPAAIGLEYEDVQLVTDDGVQLHGWYVPAARSRGTLLFFHGNAGNISHRLDSLRIFHQLRLSVLIIDYRGYGRSEGSPSEDGTRRDAAAAWRYLTETRGVPARDVVLFGRSLGAAVAAQLATEQQPGALIVESAFTSVPDFAAEIYWWMPARWMSRFDYATRDYIAQVRCPVLVVHSPDDEIIPFRHGEAIFAAAHEPKELLRLRGSHNEGFIVSGELY